MGGERMAEYQSMVKDIVRFRPDLSEGDILGHARKLAAVSVAVGSFAGALEEFKRPAAAGEPLPWEKV